MPLSSPIANQTPSSAFCFFSLEMANGEMASHRFLLTLFVCNIIFTPSAHQSPDTRSTVISLLEIGDAKGALIYLESQHTSQVCISARDAPV